MRNNGYFINKNINFRLLNFFSFFIFLGRPPIRPFYIVGRVLDRLDVIRADVTANWSHVGPTPEE